MKTTAKWTGAILLSVLVHAGAGYAVLPDEQTDLAAIAGGEPMEVAILGDAFSNTLEAGKPDETIQPVDEPVDAEQPVEAEPVETAQQTVQPLPSELPPEVTPDLVPTEADVILPSQEIAPVTMPDPEVSATVAPETVVPLEKPEAKPPTPEKPKPETVKPQTQKLKKPDIRKPVRPKAGEEGTAKASERKGRTDGDAAAVANSGGAERGSSSRPAGNAAVSNYPGKVRARLNRAFRYPSQAKRAGVSGTAVVSFTVSSSGGVSGIRIVRSAGSSVLDEAALDAVQRAAPFPAIPDGRSSWPFSIPLVFGGK